MWWTSHTSHIALTPVLAKIFEMVLHKHRSLNSRSYIIKEKKVGISTNLAKFTQIILKYVDKGVDVIYTDFK